MQAYKYQSVRIENNVERQYVGRNADPQAQLAPRFKRLSDATSDAYVLDAKREQNEYETLVLIAVLSKDHLKTQFIAELNKHGYSRTTKQGIQRMSSTTPPASAPQQEFASQPAIKMTEESLQALLDRVRNDEKEAMFELTDLLQRDDAPWATDCDFLTIAKLEFNKLLSRTDSASKPILVRNTELTLQRFRAQDETPLGKMFLEHIQFFVLLSNYNFVLNLSPARSSREGKALLERAKEASREVKSIWKLYMEYKVLSESGWTKLPGELPQAHDIIMEKAVQA